MLPLDRNRVFIYLADKDYLVSSYGGNKIFKIADIYVFNTYRPCTFSDVSHFQKELAILETTLKIVCTFCDNQLWAFSETIS